MGVLIDYFRAVDAAAVVDVLNRTTGDSPIDAPAALDGVEAKGIDPVVALGQLVAAARRAPWTVGTVRDTLVWPSEPDGDGPWVCELDDETRDTLAAVPDADLPRLAEWWAGIEELRGATADDLLPLLVGLVGLARRARDDEERLYCWMCL